MYSFFQLRPYSNVAVLSGCFLNCSALLCGGKPGLFTGQSMKLVARHASDLSTFSTFEPCEHGAAALFGSAVFGPLSWNSKWCRGTQHPRANQYRGPSNLEVHWSSQGLPRNIYKHPRKHQQSWIVPWLALTSHVFATNYRVFPNFLFSSPQLLKWECLNFSGTLLFIHDTVQRKACFQMSARGSHLARTVAIPIQEDRRTVWLSRTESHSENYKKNIFF